MNENRFDDIAVTWGRLGSRRGALRAVLGGTVLVLGAAASQETGAKKKKRKCKAPRVKCGKACCAAGQVCTNGACVTPPVEECTIARNGNIWTLQADCTITKTIQIPNGVTFDGNTKTITMTGAVDNYILDVPDNWRVRAAVLANGATANVRNLKITGQGLTGSCAGNSGPEGLAFINASGEIENVTVNDVMLSSAGTLGACGAGISVTGTGGQSVSVEDVTVADSPRGLWGLSRQGSAGITVTFAGANVSGGSVSFEQPVTGTLADSAAEAVGVFNGAEVTVRDSTFVTAGVDSATATFDTNTIANNEDFGIVVQVGIPSRPASVVARNNAISGAVVGVATLGEGTTTQVTDNTIVGLGHPSRGTGVPTTAGVVFDMGGAGSVSGNAISDFFDDNEDGTGCGIYVGETAGEVTIGTNTFPDPPGNEQNICDFSTLTRSRRGRGDGLAIASRRAGSRHLGVEETDRDTSRLERGGKHGSAHSRRKRTRR